MNDTLAQEGALKEYRRWLDSPYTDGETKRELESLKGNQAEITDRFSKNIGFGTAGLRGVMKAGTNAINEYVIMRATQGYSDYLNSLGGGKKEVVIVYDSRINSELYARRSAAVLAANGIKVDLYSSLRPTPVASYYIRMHGIDGGIAITASHNRKEYNGYKVFGSDGAQIGEKEASLISANIDRTDIFTGVKCADMSDAVESGAVRFVGEEEDEIYLGKVLEQSDGVTLAKSGLRVVHTPLHGAAWKLVPEALKRAGLKNLFLVPGQYEPDGTFPSCDKPNPEDPRVFADAEAVARENNADIILANDPDSDRIGVAVRNGEEYTCLTGNQTGVLLLDYVLSRSDSKKKMFASSTLVSTRMSKPVCEKYGAELYLTLTGFKNIGEIIAYKEAKDPDAVFALGFEESYGYLVGKYARDKDGVVAALVICEMAAVLKEQGKTLLDRLGELYGEFGYYRERTCNIEFEGPGASDRSRRMMERLRQSLPDSLLGLKVNKVTDYLTGEHFVENTDIRLESNMICFDLGKNSAVVIRPSGTEPKVKLYFLLNGDKDRVDSVFLPGGEADRFAGYLRSLSE